MEKERVYNSYHIEIRNNIPEVKEKDAFRIRKIPPNPFKPGEIYSKKMGYAGKVFAISSYVNPQKEKGKDFMYYNSLQGEVYSSGLINLIEGISEYIKKENKKDSKNKGKIKIDFVRIQQLENPNKVKSIEDIVKNQWEWDNGILTYTTNSKLGKKTVQVSENLREYKLFEKLIK